MAATAKRKVRTANQIADLKAQPKRYTVPDADLRGHYVRVEPSGSKSFVAVARDPHGKQVWATIGGADVWSIDDAREAARSALKRIKAGLPPFEEIVQPETFKAVAQNYIKRHVEANGLRSRGEIERCLQSYIYPKWQDRDFRALRRADAAQLLDDVQDNHGARQADAVLAIVRGMMNWFASRDDEFVSPIARNMRRTNPANRKRARILDDDELRVIWSVAAAPVQLNKDGKPAKPKAGEVAVGGGTFGAIVRLALLTAQRREKIAAMRWADITVDGEWTIPAEAREKGTGGVLVLPDAALAIVREQKRVGTNPYVFAGRGDGHFNGFSPCKRAFDHKVFRALRAAAAERGEDSAKVKPLPQWQVHDLRRTARSLMSRAGVRPDVAERVLGHAIAGVEGVYDRHHYLDEKANALIRLADLISSILTPGRNVVRLRAKQSKAVVTERV